MIPTIGPNRAMPPEWPALFAQTSDILSDPAIAGDDRLSDAQAAALYNLPSNLTNLLIDKNHYYGLGSAMCNMTRLAGKAEIREKSIADTTKSMLLFYKHFGDYSLSGLRICDIGSTFYGSFACLADKAVEELTAPNVSLTEALRVQAINRRSSKPDSLKDFRIGEIAGRSILRKALRENANAAASSIFKRILLTIGGKDATKESLIRNVISYDELRALRFVRAANGLAFFRLDEFAIWMDKDGDLTPVTVGDSSHEFGFDRTYLGKHKPAPPKRNKKGLLPVARQERLTCPAVQAGLIPVVMDLMPEVLIRTDEELRKPKRSIFG